MPPVSLCPDCHGVSYGWARGPCIHCGSDRVVRSDPGGSPQEAPSEFRLRLFTAKVWAGLEAEADRSGKSIRDLVAEREQAEVVYIREEPVDHGKLVLLRPRSSPPAEPGAD